MIYTPCGKDGQANTLVMGDEPPQLQARDDAELRWRIEAESYEEATEKHYDLQGWGTYEPIPTGPPSQR